MTVGGTPVVNYGYDDAGRLTNLSRVIGTGSRTYSLGYDTANRRTALQIPLANGTDYVTSSYGYDNANHLTNLLLQGASSIIESLAYTYDPNGNRNTFGRIAAQTLSPAVSGTSYDAANQMLAYNGKNVVYDANGNLQTRTDVCGTTTYIWDARNRLTAINGYKPDCTALTASFSYDALNRRISKTINGTTTQYIYDRWDIIQEIKSGVTTDYIRSLNIDEPLTRITGATIRHYVKDGLGSVLAMTDDTGATKTTYVYDAFGNATVTGETSDNPFQYTSRENDGTGLYYYRYRYYSPEMQRFISEDPIRLRGGINFFAFTKNNPVNWRDPSGLLTLYAGPSGGAAFGPWGVTGGEGSYVSTRGEGGFYNFNGDAHGGLLDAGYNFGFQTGSACDFKDKSNYWTLDVVVFSVSYVSNSTSWGLNVGAGPGIGFAWGQSNTQIHPR